MLRKIIPAAIVAVIALYAVSPYVTLYKLKGAVSDKDVEAIEGYIAWDDLRENVKKDFKAEIARKTMSENDPSAAVLGTMIADRMVDGMVDTMVTPQMLAAMIESGRVPKGNSALDRLPGSKTESPGKASTGLTVELESAFFTGLTTFGFALRKPGDEHTLDVEMAFTGLGWKITDVDLPMSAFQ